MTVAKRLPEHLHPLVASLKEGAIGEDAFWEQVAEARTPLIEPHPALPGQSIVTYVFPAPPGARHVAMNPGFGQARDGLMDRIAGTSVCCASFSYRNDVRTSYSFAPDMPLISFDDATADVLKAFRDFWATFTPGPDPHGRVAFVSRAGEGKPDDVISFVSLPDAPDEQLAYRRTDIPHGALERHTFRSGRMGNDRRIWIYTPPGYGDDDRAYPLLVAFDGGWALTRVPTPRLLDNLLAEGRIRPTIVVFVDNPTPDSRNDRRAALQRGVRPLRRGELTPWLRPQGYRISESAAGPLRHRGQLRRPGRDVVRLSAAAHLRQRDQPGRFAVVGTGLQDDRPAQRRRLPAGVADRAV